MPRPTRWLLALALWSASSLAWAGGTRVVVRPLEVYNAPEVEAMAPGLQAMLASRLSGEGYSVATATDRTPRDEAWAVRATVTRLGQSYSLDAALEPVAARAEGVRTYETVTSSDALMAAIETVAGRLRAHLERHRAAAAPPPTRAAAPVPAAAPPPVAAAPVVPAPVPAAPVPAAPPGPAGPDADLQNALKKHRAGPAAQGEALAVVVADADRDGTPEILVLIGEEILAFRDQAGELVRVWESPTPRGFRPLTLSAADRDGNGIPELFVAGMDGTRPATQALEWFGSALAPKGQRVTAWLRAVRGPGGKDLLLGMVPGAGRDLFTSGLRSFIWDGGGYRDDGPVSAPASAVAVNLDYLPLEPGKAAFAVVTNQDDQLELYAPDGSRLFQTFEPFKGSRVFLRGEERAIGYQDEDFYRVQGKSIGWTAPDGTPYLVSARNEGGLGRIFQRLANFSHGQLVGLRWDGLSLNLAAEGPKLPGFVPDLDLGASPGRPGGQTLYAALVQTEGTIFRKTRSRLVAYDLPAGPGAARP
ncbi:MAG: hypothetical protein ACYDA8_03310 [Deferrisomatales bacterium]